MKIALTVKGVGLGAWLDDDFAHCGFVIVVDDDNQFTAWENPGFEEKDKTGNKLVKLIIQANPDFLVTGIISEEQKAAFTAKGVKVLDQREGFVLELLEEARQR